ncbi:hypothetical protein EV126DRAFT_4629 [Verticillium dahliae]|nr:hypothetical protein EV126DRAFT_4629 [Verticillium dahliae]
MTSTTPGVPALAKRPGRNEPNSSHSLEILEPGKREGVMGQHGTERSPERLDKMIRPRLVYRLAKNECASIRIDTMNPYPTPDIQPLAFCSSIFELHHLMRKRLLAPHFSSQSCILWKSDKEEKKLQAYKKHVEDISIS